MFQDWLIGSGVSFLLYTVYYQKRVGGIFFRPNEKGKTIFTFDGLIPLLKSPFEKSFLWCNPRYWELNWLIIIPVSGLILASLRNYVSFK